MEANTIPKLDELLGVVPEEEKANEMEEPVEEMRQLIEMSDASCSIDDAEEEKPLLLEKDSLEDINCLSKQVSDAMIQNRNLQDALATLAIGIESAKANKQNRIAEAM